MPRKKATPANDSKAGNGQLPKGWRMVKFGDVVRDVKESERNPIEAGLERYVGLEHIEPENLHLKQWGDLTTDEVSFTKRFRKGQVLFGKRRAYQRKVAVAEFDGICSSDILTFEPKDDSLISELLPFIVQSDAFFDHALDTSSGSLSPRTRWSQLQSFEFVLGPDDHQRSAAKMLLAADHAITEATHVLAALEMLRSSLINQLVQPREPADLDWAESTIEELVSDGRIAPPQDGNHGESHPKAADFTDHGIPFIMANNVREQTIDLETCRFISKELADTLRIGFAKPDDILLTHKGTVGEVAIVPDISTEYIMLTPQVTYYRVLDSTRLDRQFLYYSMQAETFQLPLQRWSAQSTRAYVGITAQRKLPLRIPPISVQKRVASRVAAVDSRRTTAARNRDSLIELSKQLREHFVKGLQP
tara:strand:+ start:139594 stop:140850 length:1257 start_codon:yes stop_codon:yes gene_type:complete